MVSSLLGLRAQVVERAHSPSERRSRPASKRPAFLQARGGVGRALLTLATEERAERLAAERAAQANMRKFSSLANQDGGQFGSTGGWSGPRALLGMLGNRSIFAVHQPGAAEKEAAAVGEAGAGKGQGGAPLSRAGGRARKGKIIVRKPDALLRLGAVRMLAPFFKGALFVEEGTEQKEAVKLEHWHRMKIKEFV